MNSTGKSSNKIDSRFSTTPTFSPVGQRLIETQTQRLQQGDFGTDPQAQGFLRAALGREHGELAPVQQRFLDASTARGKQGMSDAMAVARSRGHNRPVGFGAILEGTAGRQFGLDQQELAGRLGMEAHDSQLAVAQHFNQQNVVKEQATQQLMALLRGEEGFEKGRGGGNQSSRDIGSTLTAVGSLAAGAGALVAASDRRVKTHIRRIGDHSVGDTVIGVYSFVYKSDPARQQRIGLMADEVATVKPEAVGRTAEGIMTVDYNQL